MLSEDEFSADLTAWAIGIFFSIAIPLMFVTAICCAFLNGWL